MVSTMKREFCRIIIISMLLILVIGVSSQASPIPVHKTSDKDSKAVSGQVGKSNNSSSSDQQFLFLMTQYWIPDLYDIKGRIDGAAGFGQDVPAMLNLSADYARIRLKRNINETNGYTVSSSLNGLKTLYQSGAMKSISMIDTIMKLNRSAEGYSDEIIKRTAAMSLYGSWLEYQVMRCYHLPNMTYPEIASVPPDQFMQVIGSIPS